jgi:hypothetical protein
MFWISGFSVLDGACTEFGQCLVYENLVCENWACDLRKKLSENVGEGFKGFTV